MIVPKLVVEEKYLDYADRRNNQLDPPTIQQK